MAYEISQIEEIKDLKHIRNRIGITQKELAEKSGVSQSMIAKIESGNLDPSYSKSVMIIKTLNSLTKKDELKAKQVMNRKVIFVNKNENIKDVIKKLKKHGISQLPVIEKNKCVGMISESILLNALIDKKINKVEEAMEDAPPTISKNANVKLITSLLKFYPMVLVSEKGKYVGIITKSDILLRMYDGG